ncbi:hypothetical protein Pcinc_037199 [Petrolisthes cinctipes]|uniref:Uncharacterized protein n=1 Tax=Petrolisthes cinctipes TaxID=88211 RepID=A0AAE1EP54_PETCI|nr:hypothetical protein Pcinc_037199 [Petrolisthes cinctipes]
MGGLGGGWVLRMWGVRNEKEGRGEGKERGRNEEEGEVVEVLSIWGMRNEKEGREEDGEVDKECVRGCEGKDDDDVVDAGVKGKMLLLMMLV